MGLTPRGWTLWISSFALVAAARVLGLEQVWIVVTAMWLLVAGCVAWTQRQLLTLAALRDMPEHLQVGGDGRVDLTVVNEGSRASATAQFVDQFDAGDRSARFALPPMAPGERARAAYRVPTDHRGRFTLGPLIATIGDPFGIAQRTWTAASPQEVIIHPRIHEIVTLPEMVGRDTDADTRDVVGRIDTEGEFHTLREYTASDDLRSVHWKSTARRGRLMVRQDESRRRAPIVVLLDTRALAHDGASFERAIEATASVATALARAGRTFEVMTTAGDTLGQSGRRYLGSVLDELAVIQATASQRIVPALRGDKQPLVVAIMGEMRDADVAAVDLIVRRGGSLALVTCKLSPASLGAATRRRLLIDASRSDQDFVRNWNQAVSLWQRHALRALSPQ